MDSFFLNTWVKYVINMPSITFRMLVRKVEIAYDRIVVTVFKLPNKQIQKKIS
jgi:hypothetical protein